MRKLIAHPDFVDKLEAIKDNPVATRLLFDINKEIEKDWECNYLGVSSTNSSLISYLTPSRMDVEDKWNGKARYHGKPSAIINKLYDVSLFKDKDREQFTNLFRNEVCKQCIDVSIVKFVKGKDIQEYYAEESYSTDDEDDNSTSDDNGLWNSCMRGEDAQDWLEIYTKNPEIVEMAIILNESGYVRSRCLIWQKKYYDRVYSVNLDVTKTMQACLEKLGYDNISEKNPLKPFKEYKIEIKLDKWEFDYYPYVDTLKYKSENMLRNYTPYTNYIELNDTDGGPNNNTTDCARCDAHTNRDEINTIIAGNYEDQELCSNCCRYSEYHGGDISTGNAVWVDRINGYVITAITCETYNDETEIEEDCYYTFDGYWIHSEDERLGTTEDTEEHFVKDLSKVYHDEETGLYYEREPQLA